MIVEEKTISSDKIYTGKVLSLKVDTVEIEKQGYQKREIVEHGGAVGIVAITDEKEIILIKQFRKPIEKAIWEIPTGKLDLGENPKECAIRELKEGAGYTACNMKLIHKFFTSPGFCNEKVYIFLATEIISGECNLDSGGNVEIYKFKLEEINNMIGKNEIEDAKTLVGILLAKELI